MENIYTCPQEWQKFSSMVTTSSKELKFLCGPLQFVNHDCVHHNAEYEATDRKSFHLRITRTVEAGEEVFVHYESSKAREPDSWHTPGTCSCCKWVTTVTRDTRLPWSETRDHREQRPPWPVTTVTRDTRQPWSETRDFKVTPWSETRGSE